MTIHTRRRMRVDCKDKCYLRLRDSIFLATVKDISMDGALLHFYDPLPGVHVGDDCNVGLDGENIYEYACKVARVDTSDVGLKFTGISKAAKKACPK